MFRERSNNSNGNTVDNQGRLITCEHLTRRVTRTEIDGSICVIADKWNGKRLNSPNDVVVKSDDSIWFTDPAYGIDTDYEGDQAPEEIGGCHVYRIDAKTGAVAAGRHRHGAAQRPRLFARREVPLYRRHRRDASGERAAPHSPLRGRHGWQESERRRSLRRIDLRPVRRLPRRQRRAGCGPAPAKAFIATTDDGALIGKILIPEMVANVTFGGVKLNRLFICGTTSLYSIYLTARGSKLG